MPGFKNMFKKKKELPKDTLLKKFEMESDKNLKRFGMACLILCALLGIHFTLIQLNIIPPIIMDRSGDNLITAVFRPTFKRTKTAIPKPVKKDRKSAVRTGKGTSKVETGIMKIDELMSTSRNTDNIIEKLLKKQIHDVKKILQKVSQLSNSKIRIGTGRRGKVDAGWNELYSDGDGSGKWDIFSHGPGLPPGISKIHIEVFQAIPQISSSIDLQRFNSRRSFNSIMRVVKARMPGLRHIYNLYLRKSPGFSGTLKLLFEIAPSGRVIKVKLLNSTTGISRFDSEISKKVKSWKFEAINARGNDKVIIPLTFSE